MTQPLVTAPNVYTLVFHEENPTTGSHWRQSIDIRQTGAVPQPGDPIINVLESFFRHSLRTDCNITSWELRNWTRGPVPFGSRGALWRTGTPAAGTKDDTNVLTSLYGSQGPNPRGKEVVARILKQVVGPGKPAAMMLRGLLDDHDTVAPAGSPWILAASPIVHDAALQAYIPLHLAPYLGAGKNPGIVQIHYSKKFNLGPFVIEIGGFVYIGPRTNSASRSSIK
jgi:hypothetical protein